MELSEKQIQKFAELERCYNQYFYASVMPIMDRVRSEVTEKQVKELADYSNSFAGMMSMVQSEPMKGGGSNLYTKANQTGMWNGLKTEDYICLCQERIGKSAQVGSDLKMIADDWRKELIGVVGQKRYDDMSKEMGTDIAFAYASHRMEQLMVERLVRQEMPKSSLDYIMKSAAENSLLGLTMQARRSSLEQHISEAGDKAYAPNLLEKSAGKAISFGMDSVTTGGFGSWGSVSKLALFEVGTEGVGAVYAAMHKEKEAPSVDQIISQGVFGTKDNVLDTFRRHAQQINPQENEYIRDLDKKMHGRMRLIPEKNLVYLRELTKKPEFGVPLENLVEKKKTYSNIPSVVMPGKEEAYLALQKEQKEKARVGVPSQTIEPMSTDTVVIDEQKKEISSQQTSSPAQNGWGNLLSNFGLSDMGSVGRNMGYVVSMLPDLLVGLFTGKTKSLKLQDNLFPIASILMGLFTKNPLLRTLLVGMGGMNLINKAGHEALGKREGEEMHTPRGEKVEYKKYSDEPLNSRVSSPEIKGNYLLATVDRVPCTIRLPDTAVAAYRAGALPLNTLVNAVLLKSDELSVKAQENYEASEGRSVQSRGIG